MERYELENGRYVLYLGRARIADTDRVALLIDADSGEVITHGEPLSVRREYDALRRVQPAHSTAAWLLLEGRPALGALNRAIRGKADIHELHLACTTSSARRLADELIARLRQRRMT